MKKLTAFALLLSLAGFGALPAGQAQSQTAANPQTEEKPTLKPAAPFTYNPAGRRDPFKDLLGGANVKEKPGEGQVSVEDLILIGITKTKKGLTAIVGTNQGFPQFVTVGDKFYDGYVLRITETQVVFRKTHDRGVPLMRPRDIVREISPEER